MSTILAFSAKPNDLASGAELTLKITASRDGKVICELKGVGATFSGNSKKVEITVQQATGSVKTSIISSPALVKIFASFSDEPGQEVTAEVNIR